MYDVLHLDNIFGFNINQQKNHYLEEGLVSCCCCGAIYHADPSGQNYKISIYEDAYRRLWSVILCNNTRCPLEYISNMIRYIKSR